MDPFSGEGELLNITTAFHTHSYPTVLSFDTSTLSPSNRPTALILQYRAQIALGQSKQVLTTLSSKSDPSSQAVKALAQYTLNQSSGLETAIKLAEDDTAAEDSTVQLLAGTILASTAETLPLAISLLGRHQGSLEAVALLTQIHLAQNRTDLALREVQAAKRWAQDSLLINLAEAWTNLRVGGSEKYQSAFYVYEELAQTPSTTSPTSLVGQAVAEMHLGRREEADAALKQCLESEEVDAQAVANALVLACIIGKKGEEREGLVAKLHQMNPDHTFLKEIEEKQRLFDECKGKYSAKVTIAV